MITMHLRQRLTHNYVDGWRELDRERFVGTVKVTPPRMVEAPGRDLSDGGLYLAHVRAPRGAPDLRIALRDSLSGSNCRHEYDCCGCMARDTSVQKVSARDYVVRTRVSYNY